MGLLRFCLALAVVSAHAQYLPPFTMIYSFFAVKIFFIISGFYMALILNEKYFLRKNSYALFITSRILRLYPLYIIVLAMSLVLYIACAKFSSCSLASDYAIVNFNPYAYFVENKYSGPHQWGNLLYSALSNAFIVGLDWIYFMKVKFLQIVPQAWTLSLEFYFYFMAPFLVRQKTTMLLGIFFASIWLRWWMVQSGLTGDPWAYRFFPTELAFFLLGIFSYRIYTTIRSWPVPRFTYLLCLFLILMPIFDWTIMSYLLLFLKNKDTLLSLYFGLVALVLPVIFLFSKENLFDRWIGEFSYPMYISHFAVIYFAAHVLGISAGSAGFGWWVVVLSFGLSLFFLYALIYPLERIRAHRILSHKM